MITAVDSNILFDILDFDPQFNATSRRSLADSSRQGGVLICEPVYAEITSHFDDRRALDRFLADLGIHLQPSSKEALDLAGRAWRSYAARRPRSLTCPRCGSPLTARCSECGYELQPRQHLVADFIIGAHAVVHADCLLTRDRGYYRSYFPDLMLV